MLLSVLKKYPDTDTDTLKVSMDTEMDSFSESFY